MMKLKKGADVEEPITGLTFQRIVTPGDWGDNLVSRSLYGYEVDKNFFNLKAQDIKSAYTEDENLILVRWNDDKVTIPFDIIKRLEDEIASAKTETEELSAATVAFIQSADTTYCTIENAEKIASGYTDDLREEILDKKYLTPSDLLNWMYNNLKTINCISLLGKGNICLDCCGGGGENTQILAGDAIRLDTDKAEKSVEINVEIKTPTEESEESKHTEEKTGKNFLHFAEDENGNKCLEVNGVDADSVYISEDIQLGGTTLGDYVKGDNIFEQGFIPKGMTLQEVLTKILFRDNVETWSTLAKEYILRIKDKACTIVAYKDDEEIEPADIKVGDEISFKIFCDGTPEQKAKVYGFANGYKLSAEGEKVDESYYLQPNLIPLSAFSEESIIVSGLTPVEGKELTYIVGTGENILSVHREYNLYGSSFDDVKLYDISNRGNTSEEHTFIVKEDAPEFETKVIPFEAIYTITKNLPYYTACSVELHTFDDPTKTTEYEEFFASQAATAHTDDLTAKNPVVVDPTWGCNQIILAFKKGLIEPKSYQLGEFDFHENELMSITVNDITLYGIDYTVIALNNKDTEDALSSNDKLVIKF